MPIHRLTPKRIASIKRKAKPGMYGDGGKLYLFINRTGSVTWIFRYRHAGRPRMMGLGPLHSMGIADARERARKARELLVAGSDPIANRGTIRKAPTFSDCYTDFLAKARVANPDVYERWDESLKHCGVIVEMEVNKVSKQDILKLLQPFWKDGRAESGRRIHMRLRKVFDHAKHEGWYAGDNPADWTYLKTYLGSQEQGGDSEHFAAMPFAEIPAFTAQLAELDDIAAAALRFVVLTARRAGDVLGQKEKEGKPPIRWTDIDLDAARWIIPKTKIGEKVPVPLSRPALDLLRKIRAQRPTDEFVFQIAPGRTLHRDALRKIMGRLAPGFDVHGLRATFRTWASTKTLGFEDMVVEAALDHVIGNKVRRVYDRSDCFFEKRRPLMDRWAEHCMTAAKILKLSA